MKTKLKKPKPYNRMDQVEDRLWDLEDKVEDLEDLDHWFSNLSNATTL